MAWRRQGDKPLSEPMVVDLPTHRCVARPQYVKYEIVHGSPEDSSELPSHEAVGVRQLCKGVTLYNDYGVDFNRSKTDLNVSAKWKYAGKKK